MSPRLRGIVQLVGLIGFAAALFILFPRAFAFVEMAAREARYFWWVILLLALAAWLVWGIKRRD